jgi:hypothetical protein
MCGAPKKEMPVPLAIPLAMAGASLASSIFGGISSKKAADRERARLEEERRRTEAERKRKANEDYIDTAAGQNLLRVARQERDKMWQREAGAAAVAGGTDAATAMAKESGNRMMGETIANIAANDTARKDQIDASYRQDLSRINQQQIAADREQAQNTAAVAGQASSALMQGALSTFGNTKLGQSWFGEGTKPAPTGAPEVPATPAPKIATQPISPQMFKHDFGHVNLGSLNPNNNPLANFLKTSKTLPWQQISSIR